jgi:magnesium-transporting ATPase (P-type)
VQALQAAGHVVAVTGDGVNDAPALKRADIGIAMGRSGTDVAREAADMVLVDDHFATIVDAIEVGRAVYDNIRRFVIYVFNSNVAEAAPFALTLASRGLVPLPLTIMQVLAIDLGTDMVPAIGLGAEPANPGVMARPPRSRRESLVSPGVLALAFCWYGLLEAIAGLAAYFFVNWRHGWPALALAPAGSDVYRQATTAVLAAIVASQAGAVLGCRTQVASLFSVGLLSNRLVLWGLGVEFTLLLALVHVPAFGRIFGTVPLEWPVWAFVLICGPLILMLDEARKAMVRRRQALSDRSPRIDRGQSGSA